MQDLERNIKECVDCGNMCSVKHSFCMKCGSNLIEQNKINVKKVIENVNLIKKNLNDLRENKQNIGEEIILKIDEKKCINCSNVINVDEKECPVCFFNFEQNKILEESNVSPKKKGKSIVFIAIAILCLLVISVLAIAYITMDNKDKKTIESVETMVDAVSGTNDYNQFIKDVIEDFNIDNNISLKKYISDDYGFFSITTERWSAYDLFKFTKNNANLNSFGNTISNIISYDSFPNYIGNTEFEKHGAFVEPNYKLFFKNLEFEFPHIDISMSSEDNYKLYRDFEDKCNYKIQSISSNGEQIVIFYFVLNDNEKFLLGVACKNVEDFEFLNPKLNPISFDNEIQVTNYLSDKVFKNVDGYFFINFNTKQINCPNLTDGYSEVFFENYKIGKRDIINEKISIRTITFEGIYSNNTDFNNDNIEIIMTSLGEFLVINSGAMGNYKLK